MILRLGPACVVGGNPPNPLLLLLNLPRGNDGDNAPPFVVIGDRPILLLIRMLRLGVGLLRLVLLRRVMPVVPTGGGFEEEDIRG
jgi:hypothetical protein